MVGGSVADDVSEFAATVTGLEGGPGECDSIMSWPVGPTGACSGLCASCIEIVGSVVTVAS